MEPVKVFIDLPLNDNTTFLVSLEDVETWKKLYPAVDVEQQLRNIKGWCLANPKRRKTRTGIKRCINSWLQKEQNSSRADNSFSQGKIKTFDELEAERREQQLQRAREYDLRKAAERAAQNGNEEEE